MVTELLDDVYDITAVEEDGRRYRVYLFDRDVPTLFDTGYRRTSESVIEGIADVGTEPERLIVTHEDDDHSGAFDEIVDRYGVETWVPAGDAAAIEASAEHAPDHEYEDGTQIGPFTAVEVPGHTPGSSVLIDESAGLAVTGDALFGADLRGIPGGYLLPPPEVYSDDPAAAERNLENLLPYDFDTALVFHGSAVLSDASEKIEAYVEFPGKPSR
jgi:glyoxylase-like metal-dependent hydrolase (beta-lactamase superfamily II)